MSEIEISQLNIFPVKSLRGISVSVMELDVIGPRYDRQWMVIDSNNHFLTQRNCPKMALINTSINSDVLSLHVEGMEPLTIAETTDKVCDVTVWNDTVEAEDCGEAAAVWLSDFLGIECRLVKMPETTQRRVDPNYAKQGELVRFADGFPLLLISEASLENFNQHLTTPIGMERFRPNLVVKGCDAYAEDFWQRVQIGETEFSLCKPCSRCVMPSIDPLTAEKQPEVSKALAQCRRRDGAVYFGQNVLFNRPSEIRVGDKIKVSA